jgi:hypothetical protein
MRIASYNVENLFRRPVALQQETWAQGRPVLEAFGELQVLLEHPVYSAADKQRILTLLATLGLTKADESQWAFLRRSRGQLLRRPKTGPVVVTAGGRDEWIGWLELKRKAVNAGAVAGDREARRREMPGWRGGRVWIAPLGSAMARQNHGYRLRPGRPRRRGGEAAEALSLIAGSVSSCGGVSSAGACSRRASVSCTGSVGACPARRVGRRCVGNAQTRHRAGLPHGRGRRRPEQVPTSGDQQPQVAALGRHPDAAEVGAHRSCRVTIRSRALRGR